MISTWSFARDIAEAAMSRRRRRGDNAQALKEIGNQSGSGVLPPLPGQAGYAPPSSEDVEEKALRDLGID